ncbi:permease prefix domain 1-containing protein [Gracilibacillus dipsosauri]|uniref:permease prefix domain 1-containing protein n=1 Tax=Gracilibacillus dipsosauri TaxID=178340 RepID=UPI00240963D4
MDTIMNYLENMFASMPKSKQMQQLKDDLLVHMEDKYQELKRAGKSENEAIGVVIAEFGNMEEIMDEFGIDLDDDRANEPFLMDEEIEEYLHVSKKTSIWIGIGVGLCIISAAMFVFIAGLQNNGFLNEIPVKTANIIGVICLIVFVAIAVGLFIYNGMKIEKYDYIHTEHAFQLSFEQKNSIQTRKEAHQPKYLAALICGIALIILSPVVLFTTLAINEQFTHFGVVGLLWIVAIGIFLLIFFTTEMDAYKNLLKEGVASKSKKNEKRDRITGAVAVIIWSLATIIFLISGFLYNQWHINWLVFAIAGIFIGMFNAAYSILTKNE